MNGIIERLADRGAIGRVVLYGVLGVVTVQAVNSVRLVVSVADRLAGRESSPCTDCNEKRAAVVDVQPPTEMPAGDPSSGSAGE